MSVMFHPLRVRAVLPDTAEAVIVSFEVPAELRETIGGQDLRRSYSTSRWTRPRSRPASS